MHQRYVQELGTPAPPTVDRLIVNVFIGLFQKHVAPTFPCFQNYRIRPSTPEEEYLAMAAGGGLYCTAAKSELIAQWLHHFSRRKLLTTIKNQQPLSQKQHRHAIKTWILTEIFAFVSGDTKCIALLDIYHPQLIQAVRRARTQPESSPEEKAHFSEILGAVNLLESYRTILSQRPSMINPCWLMSGSKSRPLDNLTNLGSGAALDPDSILLSLCSLPAPSSSKLEGLMSCPSVSLSSLCSIVILSSQLCRFPGSMSPTSLQTCADESPERTSSQTGWRQREYLELLLRNWLASHPAAPQPEILMLFHAIHISLYSNFTNLEKTARQYLVQQQHLEHHHDPATRHRDRDGDAAGPPPPPHTEQCTEEPQDLPVTEFCCFGSDEEQEKANWHAKKTLTIAQGLNKLNEPWRSSKEHVHLLEDAKSGEWGEAIHYSWAVYYASLVLWRSSNSDVRNRSPFSDVFYTNRPSQYHLRQAINLLDGSASQVAKMFSIVLKALETRP